MTEVIQADQLQQLVSKIENIEQERLESSDLLKDALFLPPLFSHFLEI